MNKQRAGWLVIIFWLIDDSCSVMLMWQRGGCSVCISALIFVCVTASQFPEALWSVGRSVVVSQSKQRLQAVGGSGSVHRPLVFKYRPVEQRKSLSSTAGTCLNHHDLMQLFLNPVFFYRLHGKWRHHCSCCCCCCCWIFSSCVTEPLWSELRWRLHCRLRLFIIGRIYYFPPSSLLLVQNSVLCTGNPAWELPN